MGIPSYFKSLAKKHDHTILDLKDSELNVHQLFFDLNGLIHPVAAHTRKTHPHLSGDSLEDKIHVAIKDEIVKIAKLSQVSELIYLAVDGVAPFAKITQQRTRRYKSFMVKKMVNAVHEKHGEPCDKWDTNAISPGTSFMNRLMQYLGASLGAIQEATACQVIFSGSNEPSEGEHKIIQYIKEEAEKVGQDENNKNKVIYGLDADLIMLSIISNVPDIHLLRESVHFGKVLKDRYLYLRIDPLRKALTDEIRSYILHPNTPSAKASLQKTRRKGSSHKDHNQDDDPHHNQDHKKGQADIKTPNDQQLIHDYVFLCFMMGNDFLPHLPALHIHLGGIEYLLELYADAIHTEGYVDGLVQPDGQPRMPFLLYIFKQLAQEESTMLHNFYQSYSRTKYREPAGLTPLQSELRKIDFLPIYKKTKDTVLFGKDGWETRYYQRFLCTEDVFFEDRMTMVKNYLEGLVWTYKYYTKGCCDWHWYYRSTCAPTSRDIYRYLSNHIGELVLHLDSTTQPLTPPQQLMCILPPVSQKLIDPKHRHLMTSKESPLYHYYPMKFHVEVLYKRYFHEATLNLPNIDVSKIIQQVHA